MHRTCNIHIFVFRAYSSPLCVTLIFNKIHKVTKYVKNIKTYYEEKKVLNIS